jgi:phage gp29-like protein
MATDHGKVGFNVANSAVLLEPSIRTYYDWTPQLIRGAEAIADGGSMRAAADLCDQMFADDRLLGVMNKRIQGVLGLPISFEPGAGKKRPVKALEAGEDWWKCYPEEELLEWGKWGFGLGIGVARTPWAPDLETGRVVARMQTWHPRHLTWDWSVRRWKIRVASGNDVFIDEDSGEWMLLTPYGKSRPWAKGLWRALSRWWLLKQYAIVDWGQYSERHGQGMFVGETQPGASPGTQDRKQLAADLKGIGRATSIGMPPGWSLKLVEATANNWQTFREQKTAADLAYAVLVLGQNLSTEVTGGSLAATDAHKNIEQGVLRFTAEAMATTIHDRSLIHWAEFNFGSRDAAPWPMWPVDPPEDLLQTSQLFTQLGTALDTFAKYKIPVDLQALLDRFKVPLKAGADLPEELVAPPPPPNPFAPPPPGGKPGTKEPNDNGDDEGASDEGDTQEGDEGADAGGKAHRTKAPSRKGLLEGQAYTDRVAESGAARAAKTLRPDVNAILEAINSGQSYADVKARVLKAFQGMDRKELAGVVRAAMLMTELAGRASVKQDT